MSHRIVLGIADQTMTNDLLSRLEILDDLEIVAVGENDADVMNAVISYEPDLLIVDRDLPPGPVTRLAREVSTRRPALPILMASRSAGSEVLTVALEAGARGVLGYPFVLAEVQDSVRRALEWGSHMEELLAGGVKESSGRGGVVTFVGSKGGVGTTVIASHLAWSLVKDDAERRVCLVDLDLEKGDVPSYIDLSHRVSIVDIAKIADDLTDRVVRDTVAVHDSGLHILPAPTDIRDVDVVTAHAVRQVLVQLRHLYDVVVVDAGSNVTPAQAAAVEMGDHVVQVVTSDVPALRAARRQVLAWQQLGISEPGESWVLVNKFTRESEIQQATVDRLVLGRRLDVMIPDLRRGLEVAINTRTPSAVGQKVWWQSLRQVAVEAGAVEDRPAPTRRGRGRAARKEPSPAERGQVALETVGMLPLTLLMLVALWQVVGLGMSFVWAGHAAAEAAREVSLNSPPAQVAAAARDAVPGRVADNMTVTAAGQNVEVQVRLTWLSATVSSSPIGVERHVVREPRE